MKEKPLSICIVCIANYCRSPVAENILNEFHNDYVEVISAGINPVYTGDMDKRSREFLNENGVDFKIHTPKKISKKIIENNDIIFALDFLVLKELNKIFPEYISKFKLLTIQHRHIQLIDPFRLNDDQYKEIMQNIYKVCTEIDFKKIL